MSKPKVVIAGATGFVGRWLVDTYRERWDITALTRDRVVEETPGIQWKTVNLFSYRSVQEVLEGADYAIYLIHSMQPSTQLHQASFQDTDLFLGDTFGRAAASQNLKQIVYLGGTLPKDKHSWSKHLKSRYEVECALGDYGVPVTALRAGIVVGPDGSSFSMLRKLIERLPILACPSWTKNQTQAISLTTIVEAFGAVLGNPAAYDQPIELGGPEKITYLKLLKTTARVLGKRRLYLLLPFNVLNLSKFWLSLITGASKELADPLVDSLKHDMKANPESDQLIRDQITYRSLEDAIRYATTETYRPKLPKKESTGYTKNTVRSMQRFVNPKGKDAIWVANAYKEWLPIYFKSIIQVKADRNNNFNFYILRIPWPILKLKYVAERSSENRQLFLVAGGLLARTIDMDTGYLEFRTVLNQTTILTAIHEFIPRLPWFVYTKTQALAHLFVMKRFGNYLKKYDPSIERREISATETLDIKGAKSVETAT